MAEKQHRIFRVSDHRKAETVGAKPRLIRAARRASVENFILQDFEIEPATQDELHQLGKDGIEIETAGE